MTVELPKLGIGTNRFGRAVDVATAETILAAAIDEGATLVDTAEAYREGASESVIGDAPRRLGRRQDVIIATKFRATRDPIKACDGSLSRLGTDHIDLYQMHNPNPDVPVEETLGTLARLIDVGKVRAIGSSNFAGWQIADADWKARSMGLPRFETAQNRYNLAERDAEKEIVPACIRFGLGLIPYFPLATGLLTGKYRRGQAAPPGSRWEGSPQASRFLTDPQFDRLDALERFAEERGVSLLSVALGGLGAMPAVATIIVGVVSPEQVCANAAAARRSPSPEDLSALP